MIDLWLISYVMQRLRWQLVACGDEKASTKQDERWYRRRGMCFFMCCLVLGQTDSGLSIRMYCCAARRPFALHHKLWCFIVSARMGGKEK